jgi:hypothetical protein
MSNCDINTVKLSINLTLDNLFLVNVKNATRPKNTQTWQWQLQSSHKLMSHRLWPLLNEILKDAQENSIGPTEFCTNKLYLDQLGALRIEYNQNRQLLDNWIAGLQGINLVFDPWTIRNLFLIPMNIYFRQKIASVHRYSLEVKLNPLNECKLHLDSFSFN